MLHGKDGKTPMKVMFNYLEIETCNLCNRKCPWCLFGQLTNFRGNELQFLDTFYILKILDELKQNIFKGVISFYSMNEPLLDWRIRDGSLFQLCRNILGDTNVKMRINTNGILLNNSNAKKMFEAGLDNMYISCYDEEILVKAKSLQKKYASIVVLDFTDEKANILKFNRAGSIKSYSGFVTENKKSCTLPLFSSVIGFDGEVRLCCNDAIGQIKLGNVKKENLYDILNGKEMKKLRNKILINREEVYPCNICNFEESLFME